MGKREKRGETVTIFCDGACSPNPGKGGWAAILRYGTHEKKIWGNAPSTTNNRMELTAAVEALKRLTRPCRVVIYTDSKYLADAFRRGWLEEWTRRGWKTAAKKPVKNADLWRELLRLTRIHDVTWRWVEGHADHEENEEVDKLAVKARTLLTGE